MEIFKQWSALALTALLVAITGCKSSPPPPPPATTAALQISVSDDVNPDADNRPSPIVISVYTLKDSRQFEREDFLSLYEGAAKRLGDDLVRSTRLREFVPGEKRTEDIPMEPSVRYLGVVAEYVQYDKAKTTLVLPVVENTANVFKVRVERLRLAVDAKAADAKP